MMSIFYDSLQYIGSLAKTQNLAYNVLLWTSYVRYYSVDYPSSNNYSEIGSGQLQYFQMSGSPYQIFDLTYQQIGIFSIAG